MDRFLKRSYTTVLPAYELNTYLEDLDDTGIEWYSGAKPSDLSISGYEDMMFMLIVTKEPSKHMYYEVLNNYHDIEQLGEVVEIVTPKTFRELIA